MPNIKDSTVIIEAFPSIREASSAAILGASLTIMADKRGEKKGEEDRAGSGYHVAV